MRMNAYNQTGVKGTRHEAPLQMVNQKINHSERKNDAIRDFQVLHERNSLSKDSLEITRSKSQNEHHSRNGHGQSNANLKKIKSVQQHKKMSEDELSYNLSLKTGALRGPVPPFEVK